MKTKANGNRSLSAKLCFLKTTGCLSPGVQHRSWTLEDTTACLPVQLCCLNSKNQEVDLSFSLSLPTSPLLDSCPAFLSTGHHFSSKGGAKHTGSGVKQSLIQSWFPSLLTMGSWTHCLILLICLDNEVRHCGEGLSRASGWCNVEQHWPCSPLFF